MESWNERLAMALERRGKTQADLVRLTKIAASSVSDWISGKTKMMEAKYSALVCSYLRISPLWLFHKKGPSGLEEEIPDDVESEEEVPVVGTAQAGLDGYWYEGEYPVGQGEGFVRYPTKDPNAYALRVKGDSMWPRINSGEFVVVEPNSTPVFGEEALIKTKDGRSMIKLLISRRGGSIVLHSINGNSPPVTLTEGEVELVHYVADILKPHRYYERMT